MYSESDLQGAVEAGAITPEAAAALRQHVASMHAAPAVDEEHFRLITGFNDIFVSIAIVLLLVATGSLAKLVSENIVGYAVAAIAWALAEYFTARRRMALPSIILVVAFVGGIAASTGALLDIGGSGEDAVNALKLAGVAAASAVAAGLHWRRFMVPITIAAMALAAAGIAIALIASVIGNPADVIKWLVFAAGLGIFAFAMRWDMSDLERKTRRSDVAFWLHLVAAPAIAHPIFSQFGVFDGEIGAGVALLVVALYVAFGLVALAIDRRAILVSGLAYVLYALYSLFAIEANVELGVALAIFVIASALLLLSAFWTNARALVVGGLPAGMKAKLPVTGSASVPATSG
ncbi:MAG: hypothetical protein R3E02_15085 [Blastomonas sp.]